MIKTVLVDGVGWPTYTPTIDPAERGMPMVDYIAKHPGSTADEAARATGIGALNAAQALIKYYKCARLQRSYCRATKRNRYYPLGQKIEVVEHFSQKKQRYLSDEQVLEARRKNAAGMSQKQLSAMYRVEATTMWKAINGRGAYAGVTA